MRDDRKEKKKSSAKRRNVLVKQGRSVSFRRLSAGQLLELSGIVFQCLIGLAVISIAILGIIRPLWLGTLFSVLGSANVMLAGARFYYFCTSDRLNGSLVSRAIRRSVRSQN
ncbi:MAG: hypothetical protein WD315_05010 [Balneolaceae bacterium]